MGTDITFLITLLYKNTLIKCALKVEKEKIGRDCCDNYMEPKNRKILWDLLPKHVQSCGNIVEVVPIFEVYIAD